MSRDSVRLNGDQFTICIEPVGTFAFLLVIDEIVCGGPDRHASFGIINALVEDSITVPIDFIKQNIAWALGTMADRAQWIAVYKKWIESYPPGEHPIDRIFPRPASVAYSYQSAAAAARYAYGNDIQALAVGIDPASPEGDFSVSWQTVSDPRPRPDHINPNAEHRVRRTWLEPPSREFTMHAMFTAGTRILPGTLVFVRHTGDDESDTDKPEPLCKPSGKLPMYIPKG